MKQLAEALVIVSLIAAFVSLVVMGHGEWALALLFIVALFVL